MNSVFNKCVNSWEIPKEKPIKIKKKNSKEWNFSYYWEKTLSHILTLGVVINLL